MQQNTRVTRLRKSGRYMNIDSYGNIAPIGTLFANVGVNNAVAQIVSPSVNQYGLIIRTCGLSTSSGVVGLQLFADLTAPTAYGDGLRRLIYIATPPPSATFPYQLFIPPHNGLWLATNGPGSINLTYDLLSAPV